jgi:uncharacterized protein (TIGR02145 family)
MKKRNNLFNLILVITITCLCSCRKSGSAEDEDFSPIVRGRIDSLLCDSTRYAGKLFAFFDTGDSVFFRTGMRATVRGYQQAISLPSIGVTGLTAFLAADSFQAGAGTLEFRIQGTPRGTGQACFTLKVNESTCSFCRTVEEKRERGIAVHSCSAQRIHNPWVNYGRVQDREGNSYRTVRIGKREWMAENLKTSRYLNGDPIPEVQDRNSWSTLLTGAFGWYDNNLALDCPYGKLYNWYAVNDSRKICPAGWWVPSDTLWNEMFDSLGGRQIAGAKLRNPGMDYWKAPNQNALNMSGFSGLGGGTRDDSGPSSLWHEFGIWWASTTHTKNGNTKPWAAILQYNSNEALLIPMSFNRGNAVRCVR